MVKRVYIDGKRTEITIREEAESNGNADLPWPMTVVILALFVWFLSWGNWAMAKFFWFMIKVSAYLFTLGFFWADPSSFGL